MTVKIEVSIRRAHSEYCDEYSLIQKDVRELLKDACEIRQWIFEDRIKSDESYVLKLLTGRFDGYEIDDFYACTIVAPNLKAVVEAIDFVKSSLRVAVEKPGDEIKSWPTSFGFDSVRLYCMLPDSVAPQPYHRLSFEVQVKTLLEHAWAKATHDFSYKGSEISWARERLAAQIKAVLDNVDLSINEMESTASSDFLNKRNPAYERLRKIISKLKLEFDAEDSPHTVKDYKRLAEQVGKIIDRVGVTIDELSEVLATESAAARGRFTVNLSPYSIVLVSLANQVPEKFLKALQKGPPSKQNGEIVIPQEAVELCGLLNQKLKRVQILEAGIKS